MDEGEEIIQIITKCTGVLDTAVQLQRGIHASHVREPDLSPRGPACRLALCCCS